MSLLSRLALLLALLRVVPVAKTVGETEKRRKVKKRQPGGGL